MKTVNFIDVTRAFEIEYIYQRTVSAYLTMTTTIEYIYQLTVSAYLTMTTTIEYIYQRTVSAYLTMMRVVLTYDNDNSNCMYSLYI